MHNVVEKEIDAIKFINTYKELSEVKGCYILFNNTKGLYYIGQSKKAVKRVACHLKGGRNCCADVYADFKYGDTFTVQIIPFRDSNYDTLDEMERVFIRMYNSVEDGYNKVYGNSNKRI